MVLTQNTTDLISGSHLDSFDSTSHIAVGNGSAAFLSGDTSLDNETLRRILEDTTKNLSEGYYIFAIRVPATQINGTNIVEVGVFDASTGGNMFLREILTSYTKNNVEVWIDILVQVSTS